MPFSAFMLYSSVSGVQELRGGIRRVGFQKENSVRQIWPDGWKKMAVGDQFNDRSCNVSRNEGQRKTEVIWEANVLGDREKIEKVCPKFGVLGVQDDDSTQQGCLLKDNS